MNRVRVSLDTGAGTTGAVNASTSVRLNYGGTLHAVYLNYGAVTSITNVTIVNDVGLQLCLFPDSATDAWKFPRWRAVFPGGTAAPGTSGGMHAPPIAEQFRVSMSSSTPSITDALVAYLYINEAGG